jgi:YbgC/YbaW family acyl-CoA thioester hydrolase
VAYTYQVTARFFHVDRAGIIFFGRIFEYCHVVFEEMLGQVFDRVAATFEDNDFGMPIVHCEADFKRPMNMEDKLNITVVVGQLSDRSITFDYSVLGENGDLRATAQIKHAFVCLSTFEPCDPPEILTNGLRQLGMIQ